MSQFAARSQEDEAFERALRYLERHTNLGIVPGIERMSSLCAELGHPERIAPAIHVTGTNGKGSTTRYVTALLLALGRRPGTYTSPHLDDITERFAVAGRPIDHALFARIMGELEPRFDRVAAATGSGPTHFEILTTLGLVAFAEREVDSLVIEVGLGGRFDATNVVDGAVAVLTNIGLDHTAYLGTERTVQAREKAGIIKSGAIAVLGDSDPSVVEVVTEVCTAVGAEFWRTGVEFALLRDRPVDEGRRLTMRTPGTVYEDLLLPFHGAHQARNALGAVVALEAFLGAPLSRDVVERGFASVENPGRFEIFAGEPTVVVDVAHNAHGVAALIPTLQERFGQAGFVFVFGTNPDKDAEAMLELLRPHARALVTTEAEGGHSVRAELLGKAAVSAGFSDVEVESDPGLALERARRLAGTNGVVVLTGSHYWLRGIRERLRYRAAEKR